MRFPFFGRREEDAGQEPSAEEAIRDAFARWAEQLRDDPVGLAEEFLRAAYATLMHAGLTPEGAVQVSSLYGIGWVANPEDPAAGFESVVKAISEMGEESEAPAGEEKESSGEGSESPGGSEEASSGEESPPPASEASSGSGSAEAMERKIFSPRSSNAGRSGGRSMREILGV